MTDENHFSPGFVRSFFHLLSTISHLHIKAFTFAFTYLLLLLSALSKSIEIFIFKFSILCKLIFLFVCLFWESNSLNCSDPTSHLQHFAHVVLSFSPLFASASSHHCLLFYRSHPRPLLCALSVCQL